MWNGVYDDRTARVSGEANAATLGRCRGTIEGAMAIFPSREAAEEFIAGDPFVTNGLVAKWRIVEWAAVFI